MQATLTRMWPALRTGTATSWLIERAPFGPWMIAAWVDGMPVASRAGDIAATRTQPLVDPLNIQFLPVLAPQSFWEIKACDSTNLTSKLDIRREFRCLSR